MDRIVSAAQVAAMLPPRPGGVPAYQGLAESLRLLILDGQLVADLRLPSERELSRALQLSRSTVAGAYALLRERALLTARRGAGNYVTVDTGSLASELLPAPTFSRDGVIGLTCASSEAPPGLAAAYARALEQLPGLLAGTGYFPDGLPVLREQLAGWFTGRGLPTSADQMIITAGALAGLNVVARALLNPGDRVLLESPTYSNAITALSRAGARPVGLPVGGRADPWEARDVEQTLRQASPRLAYLIPDFHNPTGHLMPAGRRGSVATALRRHRTVAVVDESLVELALDDAAPPPPFASFAPGAVTIGSASKAFWGGLRIGWVRAPHALVGRLVNARATLELGAAPVEQLVLSELLKQSSGLLAGRRAQLRARRDHLLAALTRLLPDWEPNRPTGGLSVWARLPEPLSRQVAAAASGHGVLVTPGPRFHVRSGGERHIRLPFTAPESVLTEAVRRLAAADGDVRAGQRFPTPSLDLSA